MLEIYCDLVFIPVLPLYKRKLSLKYSGLPVIRDAELLILKNNKKNTKFQKHQTARIVSLF